MTLCTNLVSSGMDASTSFEADMQFAQPIPFSVARHNGRTTRKRITVHVVSDVSWRYFRTQRSARRTQHLFECPPIDGLAEPQCKMRRMPAERAHERGGAKAIV